jgi:hypothetical protein
MDEKLLFEELTAPTAAERHPTGCHHYVPDEEVAEEEAE